MMELLRDIHLRGKDRQCYIVSSKTFHFKVDDMCGVTQPNSGKIFVKVRDFMLPLVKRLITFKLGYGLRASLSEEDMIDASVEYGTFNELCLVVMFIANKMSRSLSCSIGEDHNSHICERLNALLLLTLEYRESRFHVIIGSSHKLLLTCNFLQLIGFKCTHGVENCMAVVDLTSGVGERVDFFSKSDRRCHFVIDGIVDSNTVIGGSYYPVLCTYDMVGGKLVDGGLLKLTAYSSIFSCRLLNNEMKPYCFNTQDTEIDFSCVLSILRSI